MIFDRSASRLVYELELKKSILLNQIQILENNKILVPELENLTSVLISNEYIQSVKSNLESEIEKLNTKLNKIVEAAKE
jgi:hypothetical protein